MASSFDELPYTMKSCAAPSATKSCALQTVYALTGHEPTVAHPITTTLTIARGGEKSHVHAFGLDFDVAGKSGFSAPFSWSA